MSFQTAAHSADPTWRQPRRPDSGRTIDPGEDRATGARHSAETLAERHFQQLDRLSDLGTDTDGRRLKVVSTKRLPLRMSICTEARHYSRSRISHQERACKNVLRHHAGRRLQHGKALYGHIDRGDELTDAFYPGVATVQEEGHVGAECEADRQQRFEWPVQVPESVESEQGACRVRTSTAHAGARRNLLVDADASAFGHAAGLLQSASRSEAQIVRRKRNAQIDARQLPACHLLHMQGVAPVRSA